MPPFGLGCYFAPQHCSLLEPFAKFSDCAQRRQHSAQGNFFRTQTKAAHRSFDSPCAGDAAATSLNGMNRRQFLGTMAVGLAARPVWASSTAKYLPLRAF